VERMEDTRIPKQIKLSNGRRQKRGRPRATWTGGIEKSMSERNLQPGDWEDRKAGG